MVGQLGISQSCCLPLELRWIIAQGDPVPESSYGCSPEMEQNGSQLSWVRLHLSHLLTMQCWTEGSPSKWWLIAARTCPLHAHSRSPSLRACFSGFLLWALRKCLEITEFTDLGNLFKGANRIPGFLCWQQSRNPPGRFRTNIDTFPGWIHGSGGNFPPCEV